VIGIIQFFIQAFQDNACLFSGHVEGQSMTTVWPDVYVYDNEKCKGNDTDYEIVPIQSPDMCIITETNVNGTWFDTNPADHQLYNYYTSYYYYKGTQSYDTDGSTMWANTEAQDPWLSFTATQTVEGILPTTFESNGANSVVFANAVASTIGRISASDVVITSVNLNTKSLKAKTGGATDVTYNVNYNARDLNFLNEQQAQMTLTEVLMTKVNNGTFTGYLQEWGNQNTNSDLSQATSDSMTSYYIGGPQPVNDDNRIYVHREGANIVAGVLIGLGVAFFALCVFLFVRGASSK